MKTLEQQLQEVLQRIERLEAAQACRNLMGKYSYYHTAFRNREYVELWANREDSYYKFPFGEYRGIEAIRHCYLVEHGDRTDPGMDEDLKGMLMMHEMDTEVLEVAADGQTAKGCWISPGHETAPARNQPEGEPPKGDANWCWGKYEVEFIKENGQWKIWHMILYPLFKTSFYKSWGEPGAEALKPGAINPMTGRKNPDYWVYDTAAVYPADEPEPPLPYESYADMSHKIVKYGSDPGTRSNASRESTASLLAFVFLCILFRKKHFAPFVQEVHTSARMTKLYTGRKKCPMKLNK